MSLSNEVDRALLAIGRRSNRLSSEQMRHHEEVLSKFIAAEDEEDDPFVIDDDNDEDYVPVDDGEVSDIENELEVEEELPENEEIYEVEWDEVIEPEPSVSNLASGVNRLLGEKEQCYECKIDNMFWKKEPPAPRARHWKICSSMLNKKTRPHKKFRPLYQTLFSFLDENVSMLSYVAKVDKYVLVLSTQHYTQATETSNKYKPAAVLDCMKISLGLIQWTKCFLATVANAQQTGGHWPFF